MGNIKTREEFLTRLRTDLEQSFDRLIENKRVLQRFQERDLIEK